MRWLKEALKAVQGEQAEIAVELARAIMDARTVGQLEALLKEISEADLPNDTKEALRKYSNIELSTMRSSNR